jgi:CRP/FNR family transcriptional regulator, cyclic AMP receptor protein
MWRGAVMTQSDVLGSIWLFSRLEPERLEKLAAFTFTNAYEPGDVIVEEGRTGNGLYAIVSGEVEVVKGADTGSPRRLATLATGEFFGEMALLDDWPRSATVRALQQTTCVGIDRWLFLTQVRQDPDLAVTMLQAMARRIRETQAGPAE